MENNKELAVKNSAVVEYGAQNADLVEMLAEEMEG